MNSKIKNTIEELVLENVISNEVAQKIEAYYSSKKNETPNRLFVIFAVIGSALVGLGIILILAHNWDNFSKALKTGFAFLPLLIGQFLVGFSILNSKSASWQEASGVFLFFTVGSSIALISQIYNISGSLSSFLLTWVLLCFPLIYLIKSNALVILHIIFSSYYAIDYGYFEGHTPWLYLLLLAVMLPYYMQILKYKLESNLTSVFNWLLPLSIIIVLGTFIVDYGNMGFLMYILLFGLFYNIGKFTFFNMLKLRQNGYLVLGSLGTVIMLLTSSFDWLWVTNFTKGIIYNSQEFYISSTIFLGVLGVLIYNCTRHEFNKFNLFQYVFILFSLIFFINFNESNIPVTLINILLLALGVMAIKIGADQRHFGILNYGLLIITLLIACRFFDTSISFVIRGIMFVAVGMSFFFANYLMLKK